MAISKGRHTVPRAVLLGQRRAEEAVIRLGEQIAVARRRRHLTQAQLAARVGISQARQSQIERGAGRGVPADVWFAEAATLDLFLRFELGRDRLEAPEDAGHLAIQELMLRLARLTGFSRTFELQTRPVQASLSVDVGLRDDARRVLVLEECWNTFGNIGAAVRNTHRKVVEAEALAVAIGGSSGPYRVSACWIVRDTRRNRELLGRYPEVFSTAFPGSSGAWVRALTEAGARVPRTPGLVWCDVGRGTLTRWRRNSGDRRQ